MPVSSFRLRRAADYGGALSAGLCLLHCAAGPLLLAWWGGQPAQHKGTDHLIFLGLSAGLVALATRQLSSPRLRSALWAGLGLLATTVMLADRYPWLEYAQYGASLGLLGAHLLNLRHYRRCLASAKCGTL